MTGRCRVVWIVLGILVVGAGCGTSHRLHEVSLSGATVAVVANIPPRPAVFSDAFFDARVDPNDPIGSVFRAGTALAKHAEVREARARMDSALAYVDVADRVARQALLQSARHLGYVPVNDPRDADFLLDIRIADYGLTADSWEAVLQFEVDAEMILLDRRNRQVVWKKRIREVEPVSQAQVPLGTTFGNVYTARALARLSVEEMVVALENLADYTADHLAAALRHDYYAVR